MARRGEMRARKPMSEQETEICHRRSRRRGRRSYGRRSLRAWFGLGPSAQTMMTEIQFSDRVSCALFLSRPDTKMVGLFWKTLPSQVLPSRASKARPKRQSCKVAGRASLSSLTLCLCFYQITDPQLVSRRRHRSTAAAMSLVSKTLPPSLCRRHCPLGYRAHHRTRATSLTRVTQPSPDRAVAPCNLSSLVIHPSNDPSFVRRLMI